MSQPVALTAAQSAIYESLVVSRYVVAFGVPAVAMLIPHRPAAVAHLGCRTGYPAAAIGQRLPGCGLSGVDNSAAALELARTKANLMTSVRADYHLSEGYPSPLAAQSYTHALALHPPGDRGNYLEVFREMHRVLTPGGQMVVSLPLRGSFPALYDMLREYALKQDRRVFGEAVDLAAQSRPNPETLVAQIEQAGFGDVDVGVELVGIAFQHGRDFLDDPIQRLMVNTDVRGSLGPIEHLDEAMHYATDAVSKYWSEIPFQLTVNIGSASARKL